MAAFVVKVLEKFTLVENLQLTFARTAKNIWGYLECLARIKNERRKKLLKQGKCTRCGLTQTHLLHRVPRTKLPFVYDGVCLVCMSTPVTVPTVLVLCWTLLFDKEIPIYVFKAMGLKVAITPA